MALVPVLIIVSGSLAFSAFQGNIATNVTASAGTITVNEIASLVGGYSKYTNITVTGGNGRNTNTAFLNDSVVYPLDKEPDLATVPGLDVGGTSFVYYLNISNLAPGDWVKITFSLKNLGLEAVSFSNPVARDFSLQGYDTNVSNVTSAHISGTHNIFQQGTELNGISSLKNPSGYLVATNDPGISSFIGENAYSGYAYAFGNSFTNFNIPLSTGGEALYSFYVGLSSGAGNSYVSSTFGLALLVGVQSQS